MKDAVPEDFASIYALISGGEALPPHLAEAFKNRFGQTIYEGYGLTETSPVVALIFLSAPGGSVGKAVPGGSGLWGMMITALAGGIVRGDLAVRADGDEGVFSSSHRDCWWLTADGQFKTGDIGRFDDDGYLYIVGRKKS